MRLVLWISFTVCVSLGAACKKPETPTGPTPPDATIAYTVVGASDGIGFGSSVPCLIWDDCQGGTGYAFVLKRRLQGEGRSVVLTNRAFPGAVLSPRLMALARDIGRTDVLGNFFDSIAPFIPASTTHVTVFTGGNDTNLIAQAIRAGRAGTDVRGYVDSQVEQFGAELGELVQRIRTGRPALTRIVAFNLPNLGAAPYVASVSTSERSVLQRIAVGITDRINALQSQGVIVIDLMCDARVYDTTNFSSDGFHPNDRGYQLMADLAYPAIVNGTAFPPSSTCGLRTALPPF